MLPRPIQSPRCQSRLTRKRAPLGSEGRPRYTHDGRRAFDLLEIRGVDRGRSLDSTWAARPDAANGTEDTP